jgi:hypothetical protein
VHGGSDKGEFAYASHIVQNKVNYVSGKLNEEDILLEIQGQKVAGYTQRDVVAWLNHCCRNGNPVVLKTVDGGEYASAGAVLVVERLVFCYCWEVIVAVNMEHTALCIFDVTVD